jgi:hypothetical protein
MRGNGIKLIEDRLREEKDPKVRDRLRMLFLLKEELQ